MVPNGVRVALTIVLAVAACRSDAPTATGRPVSLQRVSGDAQSAPPGESLERPLVARLVDADGRPVRRVDVRWSSSTGVVTPVVSATDGSGEAKAVWKLGTEPGPQRATAVAEGLDPVEFVAFVDLTRCWTAPLRAITNDGRRSGRSGIRCRVHARRLDGRPRSPSRRTNGATRTTRIHRCSRAAAATRGPSPPGSPTPS